MKIRVFGLALLLASCGGAAPPPPETAPEVSTPPPTETPADEPGPEGDQPVAQPVAEPAKEIPCGDAVCKAPEKCIHVVGSQPDSGRDECWVPCGEGGSCPDGMKCSMIHDGPGKVCSKVD